MSYSGDAAEQVVRMSLETGEVAIKLAGSGAKEIAVLLYSILKDQKRTRGKVRMESMIRSGKELKVFAVKDEDLERFCKEARADRTHFGIRPLKCSCWRWCSIFIMRPPQMSRTSPWSWR